MPLRPYDERVTDAVLTELRRIGLPLLALGFFLAWTFVYIALWVVHPDDAFRGLGDTPRFADFFYYAVSTAFISPPGDVIAHSRGVRSATMIEMLTAFALLTAYASSFVDWGRDRAEEMDRISHRRAGRRALRRASPPRRRDGGSAASRPRG